MASDLGFGVQGARRKSSHGQEEGELILDEGRKTKHYMYTSAGVQTWEWKMRRFCSDQFYFILKEEDQSLRRKRNGWVGEEG